MIDVLDGAEAIGEFVVWPTFQQRAPPSHQDNESVHSSWPAMADTGYAPSLDLFPPRHGLGTEGFRFEPIVLPVVVVMFEKQSKDFRPVSNWKLLRGLGRPSAHLLVV